MQSAIAERPVAPFALSLVGLVVQFIAALVIGAAALGMFQAFGTTGSEVNSFRTGSVLVLIASLLAFPTAWGFFAGSLLMLIGSILGLTWSPVAQKIPGN